MVSHKKISVLDYTFAVGKIRALEKSLIRPEVFEEAIASTLKEALRLFVESAPYSDSLLQVKDSRQLELVLKQELAQLKQLLSVLILDKQLLGLVDEVSLGCIDKVLKAYPSEFLRDYLMHVIDMHNIKSFLRLYFLKEPPEKLNSSLIYEGFIPRSIFEEFYTKDLAAFLNKLEYVHRRNQIIDYAYFLREAVERIQRDNSFVRLEKAINDFLISVLAPAKLFTFGPEPLLAYYFSRLNEINLIRMIILAKLNSLPADLVKERLNAVYA